MDRRQFLATAGTGAALAVAGCSSGGGEDDGDETEGVESYQRVNGYVLSKSFPMEIYDPGTDERLAEVHWHEDWAHWHRSPLAVPLDAWRGYDLRVNDPDLEEIPVGSDESLKLAIRRTEETPEQLVTVEATGTFISLRGRSEGRGELVFQLRSDGEDVWTSPALPIEVSA